MSRDELLFRVARLVRMAAGVFELQRQDILLASFPRAGSTWLRFIVANTIWASEGHDDGVDYPMVDRLAPAFGNGNLMIKKRYAPISRFVKTHHLYRPLIFSGPERTVLLLRDPRDIMVSYYHHRANLIGSSTWTGSFSEFIRHPKWGLRGYFEHFRSWIPRATSVVKYETLHLDPFAEVSRMYDELGFDVPPRIVRRAVDWSSFNNMRREHIEWEGAKFSKAGYETVRKGQVAQWTAWFSDSDVEFFELESRKFGFSCY